MLPILKDIHLNSVSPIDIDPAPDFFFHNTISSSAHFLHRNIDFGSHISIDGKLMLAT